MTQETQHAGTEDELFDLVSVLYHTLRSSTTYARYIEDTRQAGDDELARFFREIQEGDLRRADRAKRLLGQRLGAGGLESADIGRTFDL